MRAPDDSQNKPRDPAFTTYYNYPPSFNGNITNRKSAESLAHYNLVASRHNKAKQQLESTSNCFQYFSSTIFNKYSQDESMASKTAVLRMKNTKSPINTDDTSQHQENSAASTVEPNADLFSKTLKNLTEKLKNKSPTANKQLIKKFRVSSTNSSESIDDESKGNKKSSPSVKPFVLTPGVFKDLKTKSLKTSKDKQNSSSPKSNSLLKNPSSSAKDGFNLRKLADRLTKSALNIKDSFATKPSARKGNSLFYQELVFSDPNDRDASAKSFSITSSEHSINTDELGVLHFSEKSSIDSTEHAQQQDCDADTISKSITDDWIDDDKTNEDEYNSYLNYENMGVDSDSDRLSLSIANMIDVS
jgi:hypothetical protein